MAEWPKQFEDLLYIYLPGLPAGQPIDSDMALADAGLDSLRLVGLLIDLEETFAFTFPEQLAGPASFRDPRTLWSVVADHCGAQGSADGAAADR
jgi:acyl carrier protein